MLVARGVVASSEAHVGHQRFTTCMFCVSCVCVVLHHRPSSASDGDLAPNHASSPTGAFRQPISPPNYAAEYCCAAANRGIAVEAHILAVRPDLNLRWALRNHILQTLHAGRFAAKRCVSAFDRASTKLELYRSR
jgi:hypothetical protein